ncbi:MAG: glycosyltransferase family 87 protein [Candidatus Dormiibacterota bacterium]
MASGHSPFTTGAVDPPTLSLLLLPLSHLALAPAYLVYALTSAALLATTLWAWNAQLGRPYVVATILAGLLWYPVIDGLTLGQPVAVVLSALLATLVLIRRERLIWAGIAAGVLWIMPDMTAPVLLALGVLVWAYGANPLSYLWGFCGSTVAFYGLRAGDFVQWVRLVANSVSQVTAQPRQISATAFFQLLPANLASGVIGVIAIILKVCLIAAALVGMLWIFRRGLTRTEMWQKLTGWQRIWWGTSIFFAVWLLVGPDGHLYDEAYVLPLATLALGAKPAFGGLAQRIAVLVLVGLPVLTTIAPNAVYLTPLANLLLLLAVWQLFAESGYLARLKDAGWPQLSEPPPPAASPAPAR